MKRPNKLYLEIEDGEVLWYQTGAKGQKPGPDNESRPEITVTDP